MVFQDPSTSLNPTMKIGHQIAENFRHHEGISRSEARQKTIALLQELGIKDPEMGFYAYPYQLSGGMRQRVMIAIAISGSPLLLIADEPTTALDVSTQAQILKLIQDCRQRYQMSLLLITHDPAVVAQMADRVMVMRAGQLMDKNADNSSR
jgi:ABC-type dipeptide/oligopeptide/nickel transport system ATPase component